MSVEWLGVIGGVVGAIITGLFSYAAVAKTNNKNLALISYRLEQLEKKQDLHNNAIERLTRLEGRVTEVEHDIRDLKQNKGA